MRTRLLLLVAGPLLFLTLPSAVGPGPAAPRPKEVRVGIVAYQDFDRYYKRYLKLFQNMSAKPAADGVTFKIAVGTYSEVLDWYNSKLIDVASLTPGPAAQMLSPGQAETLKDSYIATEILDPAEEGSFAKPDRIAGTDKGVVHLRYRAVCIVNDKAPIHSFQDLKKLYDENKVKFVFSHTLSGSGYILPSYVLSKRGIEMSKADRELTYNHDVTVKRLASSDRDADGKIKVGFIWDGVKNPGNIRVLEIPAENNLPGLSDQWIPQDVMLANFNSPNFENIRKLMRDLLLPAGGAAAASGGEDSIKYFDLSEGMELPGGEREESWDVQYQNVRQWLEGAKLSANELGRYYVTLDELATNLTNYETYYAGAKPRLAIVLSGGGAKCAYQLGAIGAIEEALKQKREQEGSDVDIGLVVGTSGGAINALSTALRLTDNGDGYKTLADTWKRFDQRDFFKPWFGASLIFGLALGLFQALFIIALVSLFLWARGRSKGLKAGAILSAFLLGGLALSLLALWSWKVALLCVILACLSILLFGAHEPQAWLKPAAVTLFLVGCVQLLLAWVVPNPGLFVSSFANSHLLEHLWMLVTLASLWSFPWPLVAGLLLYAYGMRKGGWVGAQRRAIVYLLLLSLATVSFGLLSLCFAQYSSLTQASGIENAFAQNMPALLGEHLGHRLKDQNLGDDERQRLLRAQSRLAQIVRETSLSIGQRLLDLTGNRLAEANSRRLRELSELIIQEKLLQRDMVITGSELSSQLIQPTAPGQSEPDSGVKDDSLPEDLYFYYAQGVPPADPRFIPLEVNQGLLLDVVVGSSTIFPVFPYKTLENVHRSGTSPERAERMEIIDGGFAHNSPVEAAVRWGATHIVLIEASPEQTSSYGNLLQNVNAAFNFLFFQAQRADTLARGKVQIFQIRPSDLHCPNLSDDDAAALRGYVNLDTFDFSKNLVERAIMKGSADARCSKPSFRRYSGEPFFREISSAGDGAGH